MMIHTNEFWFEEILQQTLSKIHATFDGNEDAWNKKLKILLKSYPKLQKSYQRIVLEHFITKELPKIKKIEKRHEAVLESNYKVAINNLEILIHLITEHGMLHNKKRTSELENDTSKKIFLISKIFARCCQISYEILKLLKSGFPDAAMARWRSLHENCMTLITLYNGDENLSQMYLDYVIVERWKRAEKYKACHKKLKFRAIDKRTYAKLKSQKESIQNHYGKEFTRDYGWTKNILSADKRHIKGIEDHAGFGHLRTFYDLASDNVHSGITSQIDRMGLESELSSESFIGKSFVGFTDPAQLTSYSLLSLIEILTKEINSVGNEMLLDLFGSLQKKLVIEFEKSENRILNKYNF